MSGSWLLLRGLTREAGHWGDLPARLAARVAPATVAALDLPGAGTRWREASPLTVAGITEAVRAEALRWPRPWRLLGLSMGGMVAVDWATRHPHELAGVLVVNASARPFAGTAQRLRPAAWPALLRVLLGGDPQACERAVLRCTSAWPARHVARVHDWVALRQAHPPSRRNALRQLVAAARFRAPGQAPAPPLRLLCGARDALVDPACSLALGAAWSVPVVVHPQAGHDLPLDAPDWLVAQAVDLDRWSAAVAAR